MKNWILPVLATASVLGTVRAQTNHMPYAPTTPSAPPPYVYEQKALPRPAAIIDPQQAQGIVDQFRASYSALGSPRILICVNRQLMSQQPGLKLSGRTETVDTTTTASNTASTDTNAPGFSKTVTTRTIANNTYEDNGKSATSLADLQTMRDVERLVGRPLRAAGATLVDQSAVAALNADQPLDAGSLQNGSTRDAVSKVADIVLEVLVSSRQVSVPEVTGDKTYLVPDIQVTAISTKDGKILGQASATDIINKAGGSGYVARNYGVSDVTEATALALMDDIVHEGK